MPYEALVIAVIVVLNALLGYVQEARAEQAVAALQQMAAATAGVVRDGREERIAASDVVPGDVLVLAEGDAVSADARLVEAQALTGFIHDNGLAQRVGRGAQRASPQARV